MSTIALAMLLFLACLIPLHQAASHDVQPTYSAVPNIPAVESDALLQFKAHLSHKGSNVLLMRGWDRSNMLNVCKSWQGLTCDWVGSGFHIVGINLTGWGLGGSLAPQLGNLISLSSLDLFNNAITGFIPPSLSNCSSLVYLDLRTNYFTGAVPDEFGILGQLQTLQLSKNSLTGSIPRSLGNSTNLSLIDLASNYVTGPIPAELGLLRSIEVLSLQSNRLTGNIPSSLENCTNLFSLDLSTNMLTGSIPMKLGPLQNLTVLYLNQNNLTGAIPRSMGNFTYLIELTLDENQLTGSIPNELGSLRDLRGLSLSLNNLTGAIPRSMGNFTYLSYLYLSANQFTGSVPNELGLLSRLTMLFLAMNNLTGPLPASLGNCTSLNTLELETNELTGPIPDELGLLSSLKWFNGWENNLTGTIPSSLGNCTSLTVLNLALNLLTGLIPSALTTFQSMEMLYLYENNLSGFERLISFGNLSSLIGLDMGANDLSGSIPSEIGQIQTLQFLDLSSNQFVGDIPWKFLANCSSLYTLNLSDNRLSGGISSLLGRFKALGEIYLQNNFLQGVIPTFEGDSLKLLAVDVSFNRLNGPLPLDFVRAIGSSMNLIFSHNHFTGSIPMWFENVRMVQRIDFSHNHFVGTIPEGLGNCIQLIYLDLSQNSLAGELPASLTSLTAMETLDLSNNNLTGPLPLFLEQLQSLQLLNVSFNSFHGAIPLLGVFKNLHASSFLGNPGLCGSIIKKVCIHAAFHKHNYPTWKKITRIALPSSIVVGGILIVLTVLYYCRPCCVCNKLVSKDSIQLAEAERFTAEELLEATQGYSKSNLLGEGALSAVYRGCLSTGKLVAVKRLKDARPRDGLLQEVQVLSKLRHRNLVRILGCVFNLDVNALVLEYMSNGTLEQYLYQNDGHECDKLCWEMFMRIAIGVANALVYLHHEYGIPIVHGDVKPSNILLDAQLDAHLADFGLAKLGQTSGTISVSSNFKGSIGYMAPEYAYATRVSTKVDVYSYGVVILEMLTGKKPTQLPELTLHEWVKMKLCGKGGLQELLHPHLSIIFTSWGVMNEHKVAQLLQMGVECTRDNPKERPTMQGVLASLFSCQRDPILQSSSLQIMLATSDS